MCGRYELADIETLKDRFHLTADPGALPPRYNVAPTQTMPVVIKQSPNRLVLMRWGLS